MGKNHIWVLGVNILLSRLVYTETVGELKIELFNRNEVKTREAKGELWHRDKRHGN